MAVQDVYLDMCDVLACTSSWVKQGQFPCTDAPKCVFVLQSRAYYFESPSLGHGLETSSDAACQGKAFCVCVHTGNGMNGMLLMHAATCA